MSLKVVIPTPLRKFTAGAETVEVDAATIKEVLDNLDAKYPGIRASEYPGSRLRPPRPPQGPG